MPLRRNRLIVPLFCAFFPFLTLQSTGADDPPLRDKTLIAWVYLADLNQQGGSAFTLDEMGPQFDGIVFAEREQRRWMAGSEMFVRTLPNQKTLVREIADANTLVQIAVVYQGKNITIYRDNKEYARYQYQGEPVTFTNQCIVLMGKRHLAQGDNAGFRGRIEDARVYAEALSLQEIQALKPNVASSRSPWAWWDFEKDATERTGRFAKTILLSGAKVEAGKLWLLAPGSALVGARASTPAAIIGQSEAPFLGSQATELPRAIDHARAFRHHLLADPHRPQFHFVVPEGTAMPFDPNGNIWWRGRAHMFYIYQDRGIHYFGHVSSRDFIHWRHHPPALFPTLDSPEKGIFSGNAFFTKDGKVAMIYHGVNSGNCIALSDDPLLERWIKQAGNPIIPIPTQAAPFSSWDPHGWRDGQHYYAIFGGQRAALFKAKNLTQWRYVGDFLHHTTPDVDLREDISCPDFFTLADKHVLVCISHRLGARYYTGTWKNEQFHPEHHERWSYVDNCYFAPETMLDERGRRIMWAWIFDQRPTQNLWGWTGTMSLPRVLTLGANGRISVAPLEELTRLRYNERKAFDTVVDPKNDWVIPGFTGNVLEITADFLPEKNTTECGFKICRSPEGEEETLVYYDFATQHIKIDTRRSSLSEGPKVVESVPFALVPNEPLRLRVYVDKSVVDLFANDRQAAMRRIYPTRADSVGVSIFSRGGSTKIREARAWDMMPCNPY